MCPPFSTGWDNDRNGDLRPAPALWLIAGLGGVLAAGIALALLRGLCGVGAARAGRACADRRACRAVLPAGGPRPAVGHRAADRGREHQPDARRPRRDDGHDAPRRSPPGSEAIANTELRRVSVQDAATISGSLADDRLVRRAGRGAERPGRRRHAAVGRAACMILGARRRCRRRCTCCTPAARTTGTASSPSTTLPPSASSARRSP